MGSALFFHPWIGADYARVQANVEAGSLEQDVWAYPCHVMGESHYGRPEQYQPDFTEYVIRKCGFTRSKCSTFFARTMQIVANRHISELNREEHWQKLAYSNYIQELLPKSRQAPGHAEWERGAAAFRQQLAITRPQVLVVLGRRLWDHLPKDFGFPLASMRLPKSMFPLPSNKRSLDVVVNEAWAYVCEIDGQKHLTIAVYVLHPSGRGFDWHIAAKRVNTVRAFYDNIASGDELQSYQAIALDA